MSAARPGQVVYELRAVFDGGGAGEGIDSKVGHARDVDSRICPVVIADRVAQFKATIDAEAEFIEQRRCNCRRQLHAASVHAVVEIVSTSDGGESAARVRLIVGKAAVADEA